MAELIKINNTLTSTATDESLSGYQGHVLNVKKLSGTIGSSTPSVSNVSNCAVYIHYSADAAATSTFMTSIRDVLFPIGTIYQSVNSTNPQDLFGGSWSRIGEGRFLIGANSTYTAGSTGGTATVTLTAAQSGLPAHTVGENGGHSHSFVLKNGSLATAGTNRKIYNSAGTTAYHNYTWQSAGGHYHSMVAVNAASAHNNMPPYKAVYMWVRTA